MKKHLAIICGIFYPEPSATGLCAKRFANLLSDGYEMDIICLSENEEQTTIDLADGMKVHKLAGRRMSAESRSHGIVKKALHLFGGVQIKTQLLGNLTWYRKAAYQKLEEIHGLHRLDAIFSICSPFAAHCAAKDFKNAHSAVHWCGYTVDPYAAKNRIRPFWCSYEQLIEAERAVLRSMDSVLLSEEVFKSRPELYQGCRHCRELPYILPEIKSGAGMHRYFNEKDINCVYAGSFYSDIRNPESMLKWFSGMEDAKIKLHLFSRGCENLVKQYAEHTSAIVVHPQVSISEMAQVYSEADVLINVENATMEFLPSKTFEYISSCKPIVNIYYPGLRDEVLDRHPMCFQLCNSDQVQQAVPQLQNFIRKNGRETVPTDVIRATYRKHLPENIKRILTSAMKGENTY